MLDLCRRTAPPHRDQTVAALHQPCRGQPRAVETVDFGTDPFVGKVLFIDVARDARVRAVHRFLGKRTWYMGRKLQRNDYLCIALVLGFAVAGILIRDCSNYVGLSEGYFRVAVKTFNENVRLLKVIPLPLHSPEKYLHP